MFRGLIFVGAHTVDKWHSCQGCQDSLEAHRWISLHREKATRRDINGAARFIAAKVDLQNTSLHHSSSDENVFFKLVLQPLKQVGVSPKLLLQFFSPRLTHHIHHHHHHQLSILQRGVRRCPGVPKKMWDSPTLQESRVRPHPWMSEEILSNF